MTKFFKKAAFVNAAAAGVILAGLTSADAQGRNNNQDLPLDPTPVETGTTLPGGGCIGSPTDCTPTTPGGDTTNTNTNTNTNNNNNNNNNTSTSNSSSNNSNSVNIKNPRNVGNAPAAIAYANSRCSYGIGASIGTFTFTGGLSFTAPKEKCLDRETAEKLIETGVKFQQGEFMVMGVRMLTGISEVAKEAQQHVGRVARTCGSKVMETNPVSSAGDDFQCSYGGKATAHFEEARRPRNKKPKPMPQVQKVTEKSVDECLKEAERICRMPASSRAKFGL